MYNLEPCFSRAMVRALPAQLSLLLSVLLDAKYDRHITARREKVKNVAIRDTFFEFLGETVDFEVMKILHAANEDEYPGLWEQMHLLERIEKIYKAVAKDKNTTYGRNGFNVAIVDCMRHDDINIVSLNYVLPFVRKNVSSGKVIYSLRDELPCIAGTKTYEHAGIRPTRASASHPSVKRTGTALSNPSYRMKRAILL